MKTARIFFLALTVGAATLPAHALTIFNEVEPNNTHLTAQFLNTTDTDILVRGSRRTTLGGGGRTPDWYRFDVGGPSYLSLNISAVGSGAGSAQLIYGLYDSSGTLINFGGGSSSTSASGSLSLAGAGSYYLAITGYSLFNLGQIGSGNYAQTGTNAGSFNWNYEASINYTTVPEPSEWALIGLSALGVGCLMLRARRKTLSSF
jgi:hypothetical protein